MWTSVPGESPAFLEVLLNSSNMPHHLLLLKYIDCNHE
jgi:hypothetical protein